MEIKTQRFLKIKLVVKTNKSPSLRNLYELNFLLFIISRHVCSPKRTFPLGGKKVNVIRYKIIYWSINKSYLSLSLYTHTTILLREITGKSWMMVRSIALNNWSLIRETLYRYPVPSPELWKGQKNLRKGKCNLHIHIQLPVYTWESLEECLEMLVSEVNIFLPTNLSHTAVKNGRNTIPQLINKPDPREWVFLWAKEKKLKWFFIHSSRWGSVKKFPEFHFTKKY